MNNIYYILRHGNSIANRDGIIISNNNLGIKEYGLTEKGQNDIKSSIHDLIDSGVLKKKVKVISSPFKRTKESALIACNLLGIDEIEYSDNLKERFFGDFDKTSNENYKRVWDLDILDPDHKNYGVESVNQVLERSYSLVLSLEKKYSDYIIIMVTHGDTSQILQCGFKGMDPRLHRSLTPVKQGEYRLLNI